MELQEYNKKGFFLPDSIESMAGFHAKLFTNGEYIFRVHDCITGIRLRGELKTEKDYQDAIVKLQSLADAANDFARHIQIQKVKLIINQ